MSWKTVLVTVLILLVVASGIVVFVSLKPQPANPDTSDDCGLANFPYQEIIDTVHTIKSGDLQTGVKINGKIIITPKIQADSAGAFLKNGDKTFIDQKTYRVFRVSQKFWENYTRARASLCALKQGIKDSILTKENKTDAGKLYIQINKMFSGLDEEEEKQKIEEEKKHEPHSTISNANAKNAEPEQYHKKKKAPLNEYKPSSKVFYSGIYINTFINGDVEALRFYESGKVISLSMKNTHFPVDQHDLTWAEDDPTMIWNAFNFATNDDNHPGVGRGNYLLNDNNLSFSTSFNGKSKTYEGHIDKFGVLHLDINDGDNSSNKAFKFHKMIE